MQQIVKATVKRKGDVFVVRGREVDASVNIGEGDVVFGYHNKTEKEIKVGTPTPYGSVVFVSGDKVTVMNGDGLKDFTRSYLKRLTSKYMFCARGKLNGRIDRYELIYYLQHLKEDHGFRPSKDIKGFIKSLQQDVVAYVRRSKEDDFVDVSNITRTYTNDDITVENLKAGKRYRKLSFARQLGAVITKLYFPGEPSRSVAWRWGYSNHASMTHSKNFILSCLFYDSKLTKHILNIVNHQR